MCVCVYAHLVPALYEDPTSLRADNCTYMYALVSHWCLSNKIFNAFAIYSVRAAWFAHIFLDLLRLLIFDESTQNKILFRR